MISSLTPAELGLPEKFTHWRSGQILALKRSMESSKRFIAHSMPVGEGKSLVGIGQAVISGQRACYATVSKGLQNQLLKDCSSIGMVDMRGRSNYQCHLPGAINCEEGFRQGCGKNCSGYEPARLEASEAPLVVTNYSYYMASNIYGRGIGEFDLLICDEAHDIHDEVCSAMAVDVAYSEANKIGIRMPGPDDPLDSWHEWAGAVLKECTTKLLALKEEASSDKEQSGHIHASTNRDLAFWTKIETKCKSLLNTSGDWIIDRTNIGLKLEPLWASQYVHKILFKNTKKVMLLSATMVPKTINLLGINPQDCDYYEYPSSFPVRRSPVYSFGPCRIDNKTPPEYLTVWLTRIDNILRARQDRKGIIHTVSYDRQQLIRQQSEFSDYMNSPKGSKDTQEAIEFFKLSDPPAILISPSITTGYDFPFSEAEYNIIVKVPFLDSRVKIIKARSESDPTYSAYITAQTIVQAHGRTMRDETDQSETFILDQHFNWFFKVHKDLFPSWFHRLVTYPRGLPVPPPPLIRLEDSAAEREMDAAMPF